MTIGTKDDSVGDPFGPLKPRRQDLADTVDTPIARAFEIEASDLDSMAAAKFSSGLSRSSCFRAAIVRRAPHEATPAFVGNNLFDRSASTLIRISNPLYIFRLA